MVAEAGDGYQGDYSYAKIDTTPDAVRSAGAAMSARSSLR